MVDSVDYEIERSDGPLEMRRYPALILATVYGHSDNTAFGILFDYIAGNNKSKRRISMTAPVISSDKIAMTTPVISDNSSFSFVMPPVYDIHSVPEPRDERVKLEHAPARSLAVIRFRGHAGPKDLRQKSSELYSFVEKIGVKTSGEPFLMRYNPPFTPGFLRRNELGIGIVQ